jgi:cytoskeletal protein CcmA (bactofilin family)
MFGQKTKKTTYSNDNAVTILTSGCHFSGKLYCKGSSRIGGIIEGELVSEGLLIVEESAQIHADVKAQEVVIQGKVKGSLEATGLVELAKTAQFSGEIAARILSIKEGAQFNGQSRMLKNEASSVKVPHAVGGDAYPKAKNIQSNNGPEVSSINGIAASEKAPEILTIL